MRNLDELLAEGVKGRRVLVRADLNTPISYKPNDASRVTDDGRIRASLPTIEALRAAGAKVVICAHLGRPKGAPDPEFSLAPVARRLAELLKAPVAFAADTVGPDAQKVVSNLADGDVALIENVRFDARETSKDEKERAAFATELAALADVYVDDAFGAVHRAHASVYDVTRLVPSYAGYLVAREVQVLSSIVTDPARPFVVVLGGAKVSDKLAVISSLLPRVDKLLVGGGMCFTFLAAQGLSVGKSLLEEDMIDTCRTLLQDAGDKIVLPSDVVISDKIHHHAEGDVVPVADIPSDQMGLDIGPETVKTFATEIAQAKSLFWNGPMGVFEYAPFANGTRGVAEAIAACDGFTIVGGGDSAAAVRALNVEESAFDHISTGGGASLEFVEGKTLPGLSALDS
ncbi:MAG: phosphoglycerate kinase [Corynebacteriales bacterium]|nr:phosphoglycerate kinase [Mycobacteriales bacterium]